MHTSCLAAEVIDLMYVVTSDGGSVVSDAVIESKKVLQAAAALHGESVSVSDKRYTFEYPGSLQGFAACDYDHGSQACIELTN